MSKVVLGTVNEIINKKIRFIRIIEIHILIFAIWLLNKFKDPLSWMLIASKFIFTKNTPCVYKVRAI